MLLCKLIAPFFWKQVSDSAENIESAGDYLRHTASTRDFRAGGDRGTLLIVIG